MFKNFDAYFWNELKSHCKCCGCGCINRCYDLGRAQPEDNPSNEIYGIIHSLWNTNRDIGLCVNETKVYGVMPYIAPEVLRGKKYTQAADIYSLDIDNNSVEIIDLTESTDQKYE
ncbi:unnamed protein product [Rhizophagus irregularis]|nr:unnamed protein product [Rhizophagus irregularis]